MKEADYYVPLLEARQELNNRQRLRSLVEEWWNEQNWTIPEAFYERTDIAGFGRAIATFRYEDALFSEYALAGEFSPLWLEYTASKFNTESPLKKSFLRPRYFVKRGRNNGVLLNPVQLTPFQIWRGKSLNNVTLDDGQRLVDYHHRLHDGRMQNSRIDLSDFYGQFGPAAQYYEAYLSLFIAHGVMFEDYHGGETGPSLQSLTQDVFEPAFIKLQKRFGFKPLLVSMPWHEHLSYFPKPDSDWREGDVVPVELLQFAHA